VFHQRLSIVVETLREMKLSLEDILVDKERVVVGKGVNSSYHFIDQNS
jgi:hypothetical protein